MRKSRATPTRCGISVSLQEAQTQHCIKCADAIPDDTAHDLGNLLLAFVMLWAYFGFSQLLIIWSGNLPEEITFYRSRLYGGWGVVAVLVLIFHFFVPFFSLLSRDLKRSAQLLPKIAIWLIFMRQLPDQPTPS